MIEICMYSTMMRRPRVGEKEKRKYGTSQSLRFERTSRCQVDSERMKLTVFKLRKLLKAELN